MLRRLIGEDIELVVRARRRTCGRVKADPGQIEQVLMNLAVNARDAMPQRRHGSTIETAQRRRSTTSYAATHPDVAPGPLRACWRSPTPAAAWTRRRRARIFEPFFTTKERGQGHRPRPGDGLRHRQAERRPHRGRQRAGRGHARSRSTCRAVEAAAPATPQPPARAGVPRGHRDDPAGRGRRRRSASSPGRSCSAHGYTRARGAPTAPRRCARPSAHAAPIDLL